MRTNIADAPKGFKSTSKKTTLEYDVTFRRPDFDVLSDLATGGAARPTETTAGFFYRIPGNAQVLIEALNKDKDRTGVWTDAMVVAQAGAVRALPKSVISSNSTISISLDAETGALLKAGVISKALDDTLIKRTGEAVGGVLEARAARRRADKAAKQDQLELLGARFGTLKSIRESMNVIMDPPPS